MSFIYYDSEIINSAYIVQAVTIKVHNLTFHAHNTANWQVWNLFVEFSKIPN